MTIRLPLRRRRRALAAVGGRVRPRTREPAGRARRRGQVFTLAVPTEKEDATTTKVELTRPTASRSTRSCRARLEARGQQTGSGEDAVIKKVTWDRRRGVPAGEAASSAVHRPHRRRRRRTPSRSSRRTRTARSSTGPAPRTPTRPRRRSRPKSSLGGGGGASTLAIVALVVAVLGARPRRDRARRGAGRRSTGVRPAGVVAARRCVALLALPAAARRRTPYLVRTVPSASGTVNTPPKQVALTFSEAVEPRFAIVSVTDAAAAPGHGGRPVPRRRRTSTRSSSR